jgi:hypothetical protein
MREQMERSSAVRASMILGLSALMAGCAGAAWKQVQVSPTYQPPKQIKVAVVGQSQTEHSQDAVQHLQSALADGLAAQGITATFIAAPSGAPQADVSVVEWNQGSRALRWLGFGGEGTIIVLVKSPSADGQSGLDGTVRGFVKSGYFGGSSYNSAVEAGHLIANSIATGKTK